MKKVAFITGASRGIGCETAIAFARAGFNLAISARTVMPGEQFEHSVCDTDGTSLTGSLNETAERCRELGAEVIVLKIDLLDSESVIRCAKKVLTHYKSLDVLINNAIYQGSDINAPLLDLNQGTLERIAQGYIISPLLLVQTVLPAMIKQGHGTIINITSGAGESDPPSATGNGGWGYGYGAGKAAVSRLSGIVSREHGSNGIVALTVNPGVVTTETLKATIDEVHLSTLSKYSASPELIAQVLLWLTKSSGAEALQYQTINAQDLARLHNISPVFT